MQLRPARPDDVVVGVIAPQHQLECLLHHRRGALVPARTVSEHLDRNEEFIKKLHAWGIQLVRNTTCRDGAKLFSSIGRTKVKISFSFSGCHLI